MAYTSDEEPNGLTALTSLATDDTFIVGDTSDASEVVKTITKANLVTDLEPSIDTLVNLTSIQGRTVTLADAGADAIFGWDDSANAYENLTQAEVRAVAGLATTDSPEFAALNIGSATDTTISRAAAGQIAVEGVNLLRSSTDAASVGTTNTGTSTAQYVSPDGLAGSYAGTKTVSIQISGSKSVDTALATGDDQAILPIDTTVTGMNLIAVKAYNSTPSSSGAPLFQIRRSRRSTATSRTVVDVLTTGVSIDANEYESADAASAVSINTSNDDVQTGDFYIFDCDTAGTGTKGATLLLTFQLP